MPAKYWWGVGYGLLLQLITLIMLEGTPAEGFIVFLLGYTAMTISIEYSE